MIQVSPLLNYLITIYLHIVVSLPRFTNFDKDDVEILSLKFVLSVNDIDSCFVVKDERLVDQREKSSLAQCLEGVLTIRKYRSYRSLLDKVLVIPT